MMGFARVQRRLRWIAMAKNAALWPLVTRLALVRHSQGKQFPELGFLRAGQGPVVFMGDVADPGASVMPTERFDTFEDVFQLGKWEVD